jgi:quinol monooxygenase YgiN
MEPEKTGNLKGKAMSFENYFFKKRHPIKWKIRKFFKMLIRKIRKENGCLHYLD